MSEEAVQIYYYAGCILLKGNKLGNVFEDLDNNQIVFQKRGFGHAIGMPFSVTHKPDNKFIHHINREEKRPPSELINEWRVRNAMVNQEYHQILSDKKLKDEMNRLDNMTISELKEYANKSSTAKRVIRQYVDEKLLW